MRPPFKFLLPLIAVAPLALGGCNEIRKFTGTNHNDNGYYTQDNTAYSQGYSQPAYGQGTYVAPGSQAYGSAYNNNTYNYQQPLQQPVANAQLPTTGHWEWGTSPDGRRTRIWIPDNSYKLPVEAYGPNVPQPWAQPRFNQPYASAYGRYDTIRFPDGRLEHEWRSDEPASPAQGYWQMLQGPGGMQRSWVPGVVNTASER